MPPVWFGAGNSFLEFAALQPRQVRHHLYSFRAPQHKGRPHPVLSRSTKENFIAGFFTVKPPANRVRGATASGYRASLCHPAFPLSTSNVGRTEAVRA